MTKLIQPKNPPAETRLLHLSYIVALTVKGIDGVLEIMGGLILEFIKPVTLQNFFVFLTQRELTEDPHDLFATWLAHFGSNFTHDAQAFAAFYLLGHGFIKIFIVTMLLRKKYWAYPVATVFLGAFILYQLYRYTLSGSSWLLIFSAIDLAIILFILKEYQIARYAHREQRTRRFD